MVEATIGLYDEKESTIVVFDTKGMSGHALKAMNHTCKVLKNRFPTALIFATPESAIAWLEGHLID